MCKYGLINTVGSLEETKLCTCIFILVLDLHLKSSYYLGVCHISGHFMLEVLKFTKEISCFEIYYMANNFLVVRRVTADKNT